MRHRTVVLLLAAAWPMGAAAATAPESRNAVLITVASLRTDRAVSEPGDRLVMPHLKEIAGGGFLSLRALTPVPDTAPALVSVLTGMAPSRHRVYAVGQVADAAASLPALLSASGYRVLAALDRADLGPLVLSLGDFQLATPSGLAAPVMVEQAFDALQALPASAAASAPFFLWIHIDSASAPYVPPLLDLVEFVADGKNSVWQLALPLESREGEADTMPREALNGPMRLTDFYLDAYDAELRQVDAAVGAAWRRLAGMQEAASTYFVVASLHGEALGDHGHWFSHGWTLYDEEIVVPLLIRGPGIRNAKNERDPISIMDVAPTLLDLLGVDKGQQRRDGISLAPLLSGLGPAPYRDLFSASLRPPFQRTVLVEGRRKLIVTPPRPPQVQGEDWWTEVRQREMFDLWFDPQEAASQSNVLSGTAWDMDVWLERQFPPLPGTPPAEDTSRRR